MSDHGEHIMQSVTSKVEIRDVATGLWIWRAEHHHWKPGDDWQPIVTSTFVESGGERLVIDPLVPKAGAEELWKRLDDRPPTMAAVIIPDHVRDIDEFVNRYKVRAFGPRLFWPDDMPKTQLEIIESDRVLPGGFVALYEGRGRLETPLWLPEQRVIVFGDGLTERGGDLRIWGSPWHEKRALPAMRELLNFPFEKVIISHADHEPVQSRAAYERALQLPSWEG
jgi:hypothetical protein